MGELWFCGQFIFCTEPFSRVRKKRTTKVVMKTANARKIIRTIAFYNVENLFDIVNNPYKNDDDFTPEGRLNWNYQKYTDHLLKIAFVISQIGREERKSPPDIIGLAEVENKNVLFDLVKTPILKPYNYGVIHYQSADARGIDVALLYKKSVFKPLCSFSYPLKINNLETGQPVFTRDLLVVSGILSGQKIHLLVNHWPSRREGIEKTQYRREAAARLNLKLIANFRRKDPNAKVISMGDFNDEATDFTFKKILKTHSNPKKIPFHSLFNPTEKLYKKGFGTLFFKKKWYLFDQMFFTASFLQSSGFRWTKTRIFSENFLKNEQGIPNRSIFKGEYLGGYSDHLPIYSVLEMKIPKKLLKK